MKKSQLIKKNDVKSINYYNIKKILNLIINNSWILKINQKYKKI